MGMGDGHPFFMDGEKDGNCTPSCPKHSHPQIHWSNLSFDGLICAQQPGGDVGAGFGQSWLKSGLYSQWVQTLAFAAIVFAAIVGTRSHHQFRILGGNLGYLIDSK